MSKKAEQPKTSEEFARWMTTLGDTQLIAELNRRGYTDFASWCGVNNARVNYALRLLEAAEMLCCGKCGHRPLLNILASGSKIERTPPHG